MLKSMTGYGKGEYEGIIKVTTEIRSVNHRYLEIKVKGPRWLYALEDRIKSIVKSRLERGYVEIFINEEVKKSKNSKIQLDEELAISYYENLKQLKKALQMDDNITLNNVLRFPDIITLKEDEKDTDELFACVETALNEAIDHMLDMRIKEGEAHRKDMQLKLDEIKDCVKTFTKLAPEVVERQKSRLQEKLEKNLDKEIINYERLEQEMVYYIDKFDINEELTRLNNSIREFEKFLGADQAIGKKMDFLVQEMNREINTIGSKGNDSGISLTVVAAKTALEKIREQVQNIE